VDGGEAGVAEGAQLELVGDDVRGGEVVAVARGGEGGAGGEDDPARWIAVGVTIGGPDEEIEIVADGVVARGR
jgi:hypothetical protein